MNFIVSWNRGLQAVALGTVILLSACQSNAVPPQAGTGSQPNFAPAQLMSKTAPVQEATPLPTNFGLARSPGSFSPSAGKAYLYIADQSNDRIDIFPLHGNNQPQVGTITAGIDFPYGLWFDRKAQELYVANQGNNTVTVYAHGSTQVKRTYTQGLNRPLYVIVDRQGEVYVGNANTGTVVEYLAGSTNIYQVLQTAGSEADGMALDKQENLYVAYRSGFQGSIEKFAAGSTQGTVIGMSLNQPQGVVVVPRGNVLATETGGTNRIDEYAPGSPNAKLELPTSGAGTPTELAIDCNEAILYVSAFDTGIVSGVDYPLPGQSLFGKDQVSPVIQGTTVDNNQNL